MYKYLSHIFLFLVLVLSTGAFSIMVSADYIIDDQVFSGTFSNALTTYADLHFNQLGTDFWWKIFFQDLKAVSLTQIQIAGISKDCIKQVRGFYINPARGNRLRPLDPDSLAHLQSLDASYANLSLTGWFFVCSSPSNGVVWYIQHIRSGENYSLVAGLQYNFLTNEYLPVFQSWWSFLFENNLSTWYLRDSYGGIAQIIGSGLSVAYVCGNGFVEDVETCDEWSSNGQVAHCNLTCNGITPQAPSGGGGWGSFTPTQDICPNGDTSSSSYDGVCTAPVITITTIWGEVPSPITKIWNISNSPYSAELNQSYQRAYAQGITTQASIQQTNIMDNLTRRSAAKMMVNYAINVLDRVPNTWLVCEFTDTSNESQEIKLYIKLACQLGIMWLKGDGTPAARFYPQNRVTRAQFGTMLSRVLYGDLNNRSSGRYGAHLQSLKEAGIMNNISDPLMIEKRGWVLLMLMRANK